MELDTSNGWTVYLKFHMKTVFWVNINCEKSTDEKNIWETFQKEGNTSIRRLKTSSVSGSILYSKFIFQRTPGLWSKKNCKEAANAKRIFQSELKKMEKVHRQFQPGTIKLYTWYKCLRRRDLVALKSKILKKPEMKKKY